VLVEILQSLLFIHLLYELTMALTFENFIFHITHTFVIPYSVYIFCFVFHVHFWQGHEMTHGFDNSGRKYDATGQVCRMSDFI
jgi:hypothetical protein